MQTKLFEQSLLQRAFFTIIILFAFSNSLLAQNIDSLQQVLKQDLDNDERIAILSKIIFDVAVQDTEKALELNQELERCVAKTSKGKLAWEAKVQYYYGSIYRFKGEFEKSTSYLNDYKAYTSSVDDKEGTGSVLFQLASLKTDQGNYKNAMEDFLDSYDIFQDLKDTLNMARAMDGISNVYHGMRKNKLSLQKRKEALFLHEQSGDKKELQGIYQNMAISYGRVNNLDSAEIFFNKAEEYILLNNDTFELGYLYENLGTIQAMKGDFENCKKYMKSSLDIREKMGNKLELMASYEKYGDVLGFNNEAKKGIPFIKKALDIAVEGGFSYGEEKIHRTFIRNYKKLGNYKLALKHAERSRFLQDSLVSAKSTLEISELDAKYQNSEKEKEILELNTENKIKDTRNFWMTIGLISSILLLGIIFYFFRQRQKTNRLLSQQNEIISESLEEKNILLKEIHHRVKNNLQVISSLLSLQSRYIKDEKAIEAINEGRTRVRSMALIHQSLYQKDNLVGVNVKEYFNQLIQELFDTYKVNKDKIELQLDLQEVNLDVDTIIPLGLIVNELVTNSLKYAFTENEEGFIKISLSEVNKQLKLIVQDNGKGMDNEKILETPNSFGYKLIHAFSKKLKSDISIHSEEGTTVELIINDYQKAS